MANNQVLAFDTFVSGSLAAGWGTFFGFSKSQVTGSPKVAEPNALSTTAGQIWTGLAFPNDQSSEIVLGANWVNESGTTATLLVRESTGVNTGYQAVISNSTAKLYKVSSGTPTQLGSTISGLTIASGDVWVLQVAGASLSLWQNFTRVLFTADTDIASGSPGFSQQSTVDITHAAVAAWNGYNTVQQDGIWQNQGIAVPAVTAELSGTVHGTQNPSIIYEGNAKILSGTVYKMWFESGNNLSYAESTDALTWTRYSGNPVLTGEGACPKVIKVGSTYHLYVQPGNETTFTVQHYTSSDGLSWSGGSTIWTLSNVPPPENALLLYYFSPFYVDPGGTWWGFYNSSTGAQNPPNSLNTMLVTSTDGVNWSNYQNTPIARNFWGLTNPVFLNGVWYVWGQTCNPGQGSSQSAIDPGESMRMQSTDLVNWTNPTHSVHHSQLFAGVNGTAGGWYTSFAMAVGNAVYIYGTSSVSDLVSPPFYQIAVGTSNIPFETLVTGAENGLQQNASDNFTRANENPLSGSGNWVTGTSLGALEIVSDVVIPTSSTTYQESDNFVRADENPLSDGGNWVTPSSTSALKIVGDLCQSTSSASVVNKAIWTGRSWANNQYSEITLAVLVTNNYCGPTIRASNTGDTGYTFSTGGGAFGASQTLTLYRLPSTVLKTFTGITLHLGDTLGVSAQGTNISAFVNGTLLGTATDSTYTSGSPGIRMFPFSITDVKISGWKGYSAPASSDVPTSDSVYTGTAFGGDQYSSATIGTLLSGAYVFPTVLHSAIAETFYYASIHGQVGVMQTDAAIYKMVAGTPTKIGPSINYTPLYGDVFTLTVIGNVISLYQNNYLLLQVQDSDITSGYPGIATGLTGAITNWTGGTTGATQYISGSAGVVGATVTYSGPGSGSVTSDGSGNYSITNLSNGSYTATPSKTGYTFSPINATVSISGGNVTGVNFTAAPISTINGGLFFIG